MKLLDDNGGVSEEISEIIESTHDYMFVKNRDFVYIAASRVFAQDLCKVACVSEVLGKTDYQLFSKEIADEYRADDERLFASGEPMLDFQEEFPGDKEGKRLCLTTKYLLHDHDGQAVAIFGQYHDIGDQLEGEMARRRDMTLKTSMALGRSFYVSNYVDLAAGTYTTLWAMDYVKQMLVGCDTTQKGFDAFLGTMVKPAFVPKVREFCRADTLAERLEDQRHIDIEYLSNFASGWCRASFYPTEWNAEGQLTHVLFGVSPVDEEDAVALEEGMSSKHDLAEIFNEVPGGIVLYEWDGKALKVLRMSQHYRDIYGHSKVAAKNAPDFQRIHPEDLEGYQKAVGHALSVTHHLEYVFRLYNPQEERYVWTQIDAVSKQAEDGRSLVYAMYTDVSAQKEAELELEKRIETEKADHDRQIQSLMMQNADASCIGSVNLSRNSFSDLQAVSIIKQCGDASTTFDQLMQHAAQAVFVQEEREAYLSLFNCQELIRRFRAGESHIAFEHFFRVGPTNTKFVQTVLDLTENPLTGDVVGICYARSLNDEKMSRIILGSALDKNYLVAALVYADTGEYYRYETNVGDYCAHRQGYFESLAERIPELVPASEVQSVRERLTHDAVLSRITTEGDFVDAFYGCIDGQRRRVEAAYSWIDSEHSLMLATLRDITDSALYEHYKYESEHDPLTGLPNRKTVFAQARNLLREHPDQQFVIAHFDVRHFHLYNTFFGEEAGDQLLCTIADKFRRMGADYDYWAYGRIESDVFCAFFPETGNLMERHIREYLEDLAAIRDDFPLQSAIGAYWVTDPEMPVEAMFSRAAMAAKSGKKNLFGMVCRYDQDMEEELQDTQQITSEMNAAIADEQFEVYLQPKYSLDKEQPVGAEALVRWNHPQRGMVSPGKFIPAFERNGFIAELDRYMWEHVCALLRRWSDEGRPMLPVSVNMSRVSLYSHATVPFLKSLVRRYNVDPKYFELELTESAYIDDPEDLKRMLKELQDDGFVILMDDFGSGYSSLNTLRELPVDVLKLDMKFMTESQDDVRGAAILSSVMNMSKMLGLPTIAEGVEKREQADYLRKLGCDFAQGYMYARPMPVRNYEALLDDVAAQMLDGKE